MGMRANRVALDALTFDLLPPGLPRPRSVPTRDGRDFDEVYQTTYRQVYGSNPGSSLGQITDRVLDLANRAKVSVPMFMLTNMVGHQLAWPDVPFKPGHLVDNRALYRVKVYAEACREKFGTLDAYALDNVTGDTTARYDIERRMVESEASVGSWIITWKLDHEGPPFEAMFDALEERLDPSWLAIETRYQPRLAELLSHPTSEAHHAIAKAHRSLKKRKHEAAGVFLARERALPLALKRVLGQFGYSMQDFEAEAKPVTDTLRLWHRLALAIQHIEVLKFVDGQEGYYTPE
jgi:hypothetical protein